MTLYVFLQTFVVEVIQFRNAFDAQGPAVPGIPPSEAVSRLQDFQHRYTQYDAKRRTLDSVSKLFGIACKPFPELDRTGEVGACLASLVHMLNHLGGDVVSMCGLHNILLFHWTRHLMFIRFSRDCILEMM